MNAKQRRMWVLPAPDGVIDRSDRYEIGIFYSFAFVAISLPLRVMFTSPFQLSTFLSENIIGRDLEFLSAISVNQSQQVFGSINDPTIFQSPYVKNIFVSPRKTNKNN